MHLTYFPAPAFCWIYLVLLWAILFVASYTDFRTMNIPKWLTLTTLGLGVLMNLVRGIWLGANNEPVYLLGANGAFVGALDGLLFSIIGFVLGFSLFFGMWIVGVSGGGDVKLFAALGAWIGLYLLIWVFAATIVIVALMTFVRSMAAFLSGKSAELRRKSEQLRKKRAQGKQPQLKQRMLTYSFPVALACLIVLPWCLRHDLKLAKPPEETRVSANHNFE